MPPAAAPAGAASVSFTFCSVEFGASHCHLYGRAEEVLGNLRQNGALRQEHLRKLLSRALELAAQIESEGKGLPGTNTEKFYQRAANTLRAKVAAVERDPNLSWVGSESAVTSRLETYLKQYRALDAERVATVNEMRAKTKDLSDSAAASAIATESALFGLKLQVLSSEVEKDFNSRFAPSFANWQMSLFGAPFSDGHGFIAGSVVRTLPIEHRLEGHKAGERFGDKHAYAPGAPTVSVTLTGSDEALGYLTDRDVIQRVLDGSSVRQPLVVINRRTSRFTQPNVTYDPKKHRIIYEWRTRSHHTVDNRDVLPMHYNDMEILYPPFGPNDMVRMLRSDVR